MKGKGHYPGPDRRPNTAQISADEQPCGPRPGRWNQDSERQLRHQTETAKSASASELRDGARPDPLTPKRWSPGRAAGSIRQRPRTVRVCF